MDKLICIKNLKVHIISKIFAFLINMSHDLVCPPPLPHLKRTQQKNKTAQTELKIIINPATEHSPSGNK